MIGVRFVGNVVNRSVLNTEVRNIRSYSAENSRLRALRFALLGRMLLGHAIYGRAVLADLCGKPTGRLNIPTTHRPVRRTADEQA